MLKHGQTGLGILVHVLQCVTWLQKHLLSWVRYFLFAFFSCMGWTVVISHLVLILFCQFRNECLVEHIMVELIKKGRNRNALRQCCFLIAQYSHSLCWTRPTFSSLLVSWSHIKDTSWEKDGRLHGSRAQHLHIIPYLLKTGLVQIQNYLSQSIKCLWKWRKGCRQFLPLSFHPHAHV